MDKFVEMQTFAAVVDLGSFVKAADSLAMSKAAGVAVRCRPRVPLGVRLLHRTTRRLSVTEEGQIFYARCKELLSEIDEAEAEITFGNADASGLVPVNAPVTFGIRQLAPLWGKFRTRHPKVTLDVTLNDRVVDLVEEGFDLAIRIATLQDSTLVSRRISTTRLVLCASPHYLAHRGTPRIPASWPATRSLPTPTWAPRTNGISPGRKERSAFAPSPASTRTTATPAVPPPWPSGVVLQPAFLIGEDLAAARWWS
jgi:DNA-binding transcriptional LysR family regulator